MRKVFGNSLFEWFAVFGIFILGFFLRAQETLSHNFIFLLDSGRDMMAVRSIVFDHHLTLIGPNTSLGGVFQGPFYYYLLAVPTAIFGGDPWGNILLMLLISLTVLVAVFYFINKYFGTIPAVITLLLFAVCPEAIAAATYFWNPHPMWLILVLYIFVLFRTLKKSSLATLLLWPLVALSFHFETAFGVILSLATLLYIVLFNRKLLKVGYFWFSLILGSLFFLPQIIFDARHEFLMTKSVLAVFSGQNRGLIAGGEHNGFLFRLNDNINTLRINFISAFIHDGILNFFPWAVLCLTILGFVRAVQNKLFSEDERLFIHMVFWVGAFIFLLCAFYPFPLRAWFLTGFQSFYLILAGLCLAKIYSSTLGKVILFVSLSIILVYSAFRINTLYFHPPDNGGYAKIKGKLAAIDYIYKDAGSKKFGLLIFTPPVLTYAYDYLIFWRARHARGYIPYSQKKGIVYLLIEPDPGQPWSYKGWLATVIKSGKIIKTVSLPTGIIIQERKFE